MSNSNRVVAVLATVFVAMVGASSAYADEGSRDKTPGSGPNPFTDCGIGAALFPKIPALAVTSNVIWDIGITAVTSATASPETCQGPGAQAAAFINQSYDRVVEEAARGEGEYLVALMDIYSCEATVRGQLLSEVRSDLGNALNSRDYIEQTHLQKAEQYFHIVNDRVKGEYAGSCSV